MSYPRNLTEDFQQAVSASPVVLLNGARQTGKSTLVRAACVGAKYYTLDDPTTLAATVEHETFVRDLPEHVVIDEIQRAPELFLSIKRSVDENRKPGRFILTGSANVLVLPKLSESLAGRMIIKTLWPLSQGEIGGVKDGFVDALFSDESIEHNGFADWPSLVEKFARGGFPNLHSDGLHLRQRRDWFDSYLRTLLERDVRDISHVEGIRSFPTLMTMMAGRVGNIMNYADVSRTANLAKTSVVRYVSLLEAMFLIFALPAWSNNFEKRLVKAPKVYFCDSGLLCRLLNIGAERLLEDRSVAGAIAENFVGAELQKQLSWSQTFAHLFHLKTQNGYAVDFVLEGESGKLVGVEVKCSSSVSQEDFKGLRWLEETAKKRFHRGVVLYTGTETHRFGKNMYALPMTALWGLGATQAMNIFDE